MLILALTTIINSPVSEAINFGELLDIDGDGIIQPMEAADAVQMLIEHSDQHGLAISDIDDVIQEYHAFLKEDALYLIEDFDQNNDQKLQLSELPRDIRDIARYCDKDGDGFITVEEIIELHPDSDEVYARLEVDEIFEDLDEDENGLIPFHVFNDDDEDFAELVIPFDTNNDKQLSKDELIAGFAMLDGPVTFDIKGSNALMSGNIGPSTPYKVMELVFYHPEVDTIVMVDVPGSIDDDSCLRASRIVRAHKLNTHLRSDGEVASGGTDFFLAGVNRTCEKGAQFGIHSWSEFGAEGSDYPRDSIEHKMYLDYCNEMGVPESFYWHTLDVATADDIHWMTEKELKQFNMITEPIIGSE